MTKRNNTNHEEAKAKLTEWMVGLLLSDDRLSEEALDEVRLYLADDRDSDLKREVLSKLFMAAFQSRHSGAPFRSAQAEELWPRIADALGMDPDPNSYRKLQTPNTIIKPLRRPLWRRAAMRVAAVMIPAMVIAGSAWLLSEKNAIPVEMPMLANVEISVPEGGQKRIVLPDGSQVWANSSTTLSYNDDFSKERTVTLEGEAFFSVVRDTLAPFHVNTANMVVEVLGTEFNVKARRGEPTAEVVLASGRVHVETPNNEPIELIPNERLTFHYGTSKPIVDKTDATTVSEWCVKDLNMADIPLADAFKRIASYYGLNLSIEGTLPADDLIILAPTGELSVNQILDVVQDITGNFEYQLTPQGIIIYPLTSQKE